MELQGEGPFVPWELTICAVKKGPTAILYLGEGFEGFLALLSAPFPSLPRVTKTCTGRYTFVLVSICVDSLYMDYLISNERIKEYHLLHSFLI